MFLKLFNKSFHTVNENPSITLLFVLYLIALSIIMSYLFTAQTHILYMLLTLCTFLILSAFLAGWTNVLKESCDRDKLIEKKFFGIFLEGIGKNIIPIITGTLIYIFILAIVVILVVKLNQTVFGNLDFLQNQIMQAGNAENANINSIWANLSTNEQYILYEWQLSFMLAFFIYNFLYIFTLPALAFTETKNRFLRAFVSLKNSICFTFRKFFPAFGIYLLFCVFMGLINIFRVKFATNAFVSILLLFVQIYFVSYSIMLLFNYYESKNCSDNRCDSIGQDENCDKSSEEN